MTTQTFRAPSVTSALQEVQRKLGPDAIVISVRHVTSGAPWQFKRTPEVEILAIPPAPRPPQPAPAFQFESLEDDLLVHPPSPKPGRGSNPAVNARLAETAPAPEPHPRPPVQALPNNPVVTQLIEQLQSQGVVQATLDALQSRCTASLSQAALQDETRLKKFFMAQLQAEVRVRPESAALADRVICLAGASGAGKTSLCAKLAAYHSQVLERTVVWICADTFKSGAIAEAQTYAGALGITLEVAYTPQEVQAAVARNQTADLLLVDTQSCNPHQE
ncbi:MAG TPA: hypothetical protein VLS48_00725, partial [Anaerolineales bacterium]|nr:hypothetical protein [Anaerolineales bacterium]